MKPDHASHASVSITDYHGNLKVAIDMALHGCESLITTPIIQIMLFMLLGVDFREHLSTDACYCLLFILKFTSVH